MALNCSAEVRSRPRCALAMSYTVQCGTHYIHGTFPLWVAVPCDLLFDELIGNIETNLVSRTIILSTTLGIINNSIFTPCSTLANYMVSFLHIVGTRVFFLGELEPLASLRILDLTSLASLGS